MRSSLALALACTEHIHLSVNSNVNFYNEDLSMKNYLFLTEHELSMVK